MRVGELAPAAAGRAPSRPVPFLDRLTGRRLRADAAQLAAAASATIGGGDVAQVAHLPREVAQAFGIYDGGERIDRATALTIPAVRRGRQVIAGTIGALPLVAVRVDDTGAAEHVRRPLLDQPDPTTTRQHTLTWTVDDLLFYGVSWWLVRGRDDHGYPRSVERIGPERLRVDLNAGAVYVDNRPVSDDDLVRFDGPDEGVLRYGGRTLRTALLLEEAVRNFARLDVPLGALRLTEGAADLDPAEIDALLDAWEAARRTRTTAYLNSAVTYETFQLDAQRTQLAEARQYQTAEVARLLNLPAHYLNAPSASGMTYQNVETARRDLVDTTLAGYLAAVEQRLSLGDVTPRGTTVRVDLTGLLRGDTASAVTVAATALSLGLITRGEARTDYLGRPPLPDAELPDPTPRPSTPGSPTP